MDDGGERLYVYTLVEQQRAVERFMIFRMNVYMTRIWERLLRDHPDLAALPPIVPVLIHHSDTGWTAATAFADIVAAPEPARPALLPHIPRFEMRLVDLRPQRVSGLVETALTAFGKVVLWALSVAGDDARFLEEIGRMEAAIQDALAAPDAYDAGVALLRYLVATHERLGARRIARVLKATAGTGRRQVMTDVLDELRREGREEGKREGRVEGRARALLDLLHARFGPVPAGARARILAAKETTLARWSIRVLTAPTLDAVLDGPVAKTAKKTAPARKSSRAARA